jgi:hypothetical protein
VFDRTIATHFFKPSYKKKGKKRRKKASENGRPGFFFFRGFFLAAFAFIPFGNREDYSDSIFSKLAKKRGKRGERRLGNIPSNMSKARSARAMPLRPTGMNPIDT